MTRAWPGASALLSLLSSLAFAQQNLPQAVALETEEQEEVRRYSVEIIVFEYVGGDSGGSEIFLPDEPEVPLLEDEYRQGDRSVLAGERIDRDPGGAIFGDRAGDTGGDRPAPDALLEIPTAEQAGIEILGADDFVLDDAYARLERLDAYRPLMRGAWIQQTLEKDEALPIKLRRLGNPPLRLDGTVMLYLGRFLHLVLDLSLEEKGAQRPTQAEERIRYFGDNRSNRGFGFDSRFIAPSVFYRIQEDRIVRNGELRYFDHPKFGVLAKITRIEDEDAVDLDNTDDLLPGGIN